MWNVPAEAVVCTPPDDSSSCAFPWLWHCRTWWNTGNTAGFHVGLRDHARKKEVISMFETEMNLWSSEPLTGLDNSSLGSIQDEWFVWLCWLFRGGFRRWIWQSPSHHDLLYIQDIWVHPARLSGELLKAALNTTQKLSRKIKNKNNLLR